MHIAGTTSKSPRPKRLKLHAIYVYVGAIVIGRSVSSVTTAIMVQSPENRPIAWPQLSFYFLQSAQDILTPYLLSESGCEYFVLIHTFFTVIVHSKASSPTGIQYIVNKYKIVIFQCFCTITVL